MKDIHVNDLDIQRYTFDQQECEPQIIKHIQSCEECNERVELYLSLSSTIKNQPEPTLEYNLSQLVLDQLPSNKEVETNDSYLISIIILAIAGFFILTLFSFRETIIYLLDSTFAYQNYLIISIIVFVSIVLVLDLFRSFYQKINLLNS